jgi:hypothetical protein
LRRRCLKGKENYLKKIPSFGELAQDAPLKYLNLSLKIYHTFYNKVLCLFFVASENCERMASINQMTNYDKTHSINNIKKNTPIAFPITPVPIHPIFFLSIDIFKNKKKRIINKK